MTVAPQRPDLLTAADLSHEPEDGLRRELHDGVVYVAPPPSDHHSRAVIAALFCLHAAVPDDVELLHDVGIHVGIRQLYVPDLSVVRRGTPFHDNGFDPDGVVLVLEAVSPSSRTMDRITKPRLYADIGIPYFWRLDDLGGEGAVLETFTLDLRDRDYRPTGRFGPGEKGALTEPWPIEIDMARFALPR